MYEVEIYDPMVGVVQGSVVFQDYEKLMKEATQVAEFVRSIVVTDDNVKDVKKVLANVNKSVKMLNDRRIAIKKEILEPYEVFAEQVKEIESVVLNADKQVRNKVRELEEKEREEKDEELLSIWNKRIPAYQYAKVMNYEDWRTPQHLNKTLTMKKAEEDMVQWLEKTEKELSILYTMENKEDLVQAYKEVLDMATAIEVVKDREEMKKAQRELLEDVKEDEYLISIKGEQTLKLVEMLLKEYKIEYKII